MVTLSKTQIDRLGDRLRKGPPSEDDLRLLDEYRRSFGPPYEFVIRTIREELRLEPTGRPAKSTTSIIEKLRRESIRLSQVQDIAGCRLVAENVIVQDDTVARLCALFHNIKVMDRRAKPNFGYRAVHVIVEQASKSVEIQVRSSLQHFWAELSERLSDVVDSTIKYGGGDDRTREVLITTSDAGSGLEQLERDSLELQTRVSKLEQHASEDRAFRDELVEVRLAVIKTFDEIVRRKEELIKLFQRMIFDLETKKSLGQ